MSIAWPQSVAVNSAGGADYATIGDALKAVKADAAEPNVITITGGGPYEEGLLIDVPVTIKGQSKDDRPILLLKKAGGSVRGDHGIVNIAAVYITLENLILIPAKESGVKRAVCIEPLKDSDKFNVVIRNVLVSANDGNNKPISVNGMEMNFQEGDASVPFLDDGIWMLASYGRPHGTVDVLLEDIVVTHCDPGKDPDKITANSDGFVLGGVNVTLTMRNVVSSYNDRYGIQIISADTPSFTPIVHMEGTAAKPIIFKGNGTQGIQAWTGENHWSYVDFIGNPQGTRIDISSCTVEGDHLLFADNKEAIHQYSLPSSSDELIYKLSDCTFFRNEADIMIDPASTDANLMNGLGTFAIEMKDSVIAGTLIYLVNSTVTEIPEGFTQFEKVTYDHCALVEEGDYAVYTDFEGLPVIPVLTNNISADPKFLSVDWGGEDYLRVSADAYRNASSSGGLLRGARPFVGETVVDAWMVY